ncbi:FecR domain-containing protein, partial [Bradyrhizobium sp. 17]
MPDGAFVVPDPNLIFNGDFKRAGLDLVLSHDGHDFVVHDYFRGDKRAAIASPDGAHLTGDVVNALTGHVQYAQAASGIAAAQVIGHVTKLSGSATAVRNGVSVILNNGDNVEKGDVVSTGGDSTLGITFIDGTVFGLSSNARMVLNDMVYDPNGSNNSSLLSLVAGTITFVAGETAKHGDMKVDTPVATMGIRGTAVLSQINFVVPAGGGDPQPQASFQVLVEPNGTTGSYILFDKVTLLPIATVNQAGQMIQISGGNVSISNALMSPDIQKLITDVFTLKFTDNNSNTKLTQNFTDSITQTGNIVFIKTDTGATATATFTHLPEPGSQGTGHNPSTSTRIPGPPVRQSLDLNGNVKTAFEMIERAGTTGDTTHYDTISGRITFVDQNLADLPTVSIDLGDAPNFVYKNAGQQDVTGALSALQKQDIAATQIQLSVAAAAGNNNNGSAVWTYTIPDHVFDFLAAGETLTLTYKVRVNNNFSVNPETSTIDITITITGTNDKPVITTSVPTIIFEGGTSVPGGPLTSDVPTSGTLSFDDVDLTDKHTVSVALSSATLPDGTVPPGPLAAFQSAMSVAIAAGADSTGDGTGTINWSLADLPVYLADFIPKGEVLTLVYTVTLKDAQGATSQQTITVTITGTDAPAVVWIATDKPGAPSGGFWKDAANWATGTVPTINDDVIVITDQLHGLTPSYPVTIDTAAFAKSITMNDYDTAVGHKAPEVINKSALTIAGEISLKADSKLTNFTASTISVGGKAEFLDSSVLTNAGYLTLKGGGDFANGTTITNSGTIELFGGTLKTLAGINNAGGTLKADAGTTLIVDTATISGGTVTIAGTLELDGSSVLKNGTLNNSGAVNVKGTADFAHETVANTSGGTIKVLANGWLTIDQGSGVANTGNVTVDATGKLTVNGATISGTGTVTGNGEIDLTGAAVLSGSILNNNAVFKVSGTGNVLDHETVTNASTGTIEVLANGALTIDQGSTVANAGNVTVDANGKLTVNGATLNGAGTVTGNGEIDLTGAAVLSGGILNNNAAFKVSGSGNALDHETITNATTGTIEVLANGALTIDQGSTVANAGNVTVDANGKLTVNGATINGAGTVTSNGEIDLTGGAVLSGGILNNNAAFKVSGTGNALDHETITNASTGTIEVLANGTLTIDQGSTVANAGNVTIDSAGKLTVNGATISGTGTVTGNGEIDLTGAAVLSGGILNNNAAFKVSGTGNALDHGTITNAGTGTIEVLANGALTIDQGSTVANAGNVTVDANGKLTVNGATINGTGTVTGNGEIDLTGAAVLSGGILNNNAAFKVSGTGNALDHETVTNASTGTIEVLANGALTIDQGSTV